MLDYWAVARTKPHREFWAAKNIERQGQEFYLPVMVERVLKQGKLIERDVCLFPGYIFVRIGPRWLSLLGTFGLSHMIQGSDGKPARVPDSVIEDLRANEGADGKIRLGHPLKLRVGMQVRVTEGTMADQTGVIYAGMDGKGRVKVLLDILGRKTSVTIASDQVEPIV